MAAMVPIESILLCLVLALIDLGLAVLLLRTVRTDPFDSVFGPELGQPGADQSAVQSRPEGGSASSLSCAEVESALRGEVPGHHFIHLHRTHLVVPGSPTT